MVQPRWAASRNWTPALKRPMQTSTSAAPWWGFNGAVLDTGWIPAQMRPMVFACFAVLGAAAPMAAIAAGGIAGWTRWRIIRPE